MMGSEAGDVIPVINGYLEDSRLADRVRTDHEDWTPVQMQGFLEFAIQDFTWEDGRIERAWWDGNPQGWREVRDCRQWLFEAAEAEA